ncbi:MAG: DNA repair protein RadC [Rhodospirillaceae bacterium]|nr:MAG: DNA repair protein RadC [Rhodospirillaceae bacterium]
MQSDDVLETPVAEAAADTQKAKPHYLGHRERLRARFLRAGADVLADYELLELLLTLVIPRRDTKPLAKRLLERYGTLAALFAADHALLAREDGLSEIFRGLAENPPRGGVAGHPVRTENKAGHQLVGQIDRLLPGQHGP